MSTEKHALGYLPLIHSVHEPGNRTTVDDVLSICSCRVDKKTQPHARTQVRRDTRRQCVVSGTAGVASFQMAGAAHTLPVVIQYVLYNSGEQQAPSQCTEKQHTHIQSFTR